MTTDSPDGPVDDRAARLAALRQRRGHVDATLAASVQQAGASSLQRRRRRHPATKAKIIAATLSAATAVALTGVMARASVGTTAPAPRATPTATVVHPAAGATSAGSSQTTGATAPPIGPSNAPAVTTSQAS